MTSKKESRSNQWNKAKTRISWHDQKVCLIFAFLFYSNIEKSAPYLKKKWKFAKITIYLNLQNIDELQKNKKNIMNRSSDRCYQKPGNFSITKTFFSSLISLLFYDEIISGVFFSREDKDPRLRLMTLSFKCCSCYFRRCYSSKTVCCFGTTLQKKGLNII